MDTACSALLFPDHDARSGSNYSSLKKSHMHSGMHPSGMQPPALLLRSLKYAAGSTRKPG